MARETSLPLTEAAFLGRIPAPSQPAADPAIRAAGRSTAGEGGRRARDADRRLPGWQPLVDNLQPHLPELPHTAAYHAALAAVVEEGRALEAEQEICKAKLREVNQRRADLVLRGRDLRNRLAEGLRGAFGVRNEKLVEFGIAPRTRKLRRKSLSKAEKAAAAAALAARAKARAEAKQALAEANRQVARAAVP